MLDQDAFLYNKRNCISHLDSYEISQNDESFNEVLSTFDNCASNRGNSQNELKSIDYEKKRGYLHQRKFSLNISKGTPSRNKITSLNQKGESQIKIREKNLAQGLNKIRRLFMRKTSYCFFVNLLKTYYSRIKVPVN